MIPHFLSIFQTDPTDIGQFHNLALRYGEVKEVIYPSDSRSQSKKVVEYRVRVAHREGNGATVSVDYGNCIAGSLFGSLSDKFRYTLRPSSTESKGASDPIDGSKVLLLCINGETNSGVIIAAMPDLRADAETKDKGHNLEFEFNGINAKIDKLGQFFLTHKGKTDLTGVSSDTNRGGSFNFNSDGTLTIKPEKGLLVGRATDSVLLGTTYRNAQSQLHTSMKSAVQQAAASISQAAVLLGLASAQPNTQTQSPYLANAANYLAQSGMALTAIANAILSFEQNASSYLSALNKTD